MSDFFLMTRAAYTKLSAPLAKLALRAGLTPDTVTIIGTGGSVISALILFPIGQRTSGRLAEVESNVESVGPRYGLHHPDRLLYESHQFGGLRVGEVFQFRYPAVRHHHQMPRVVRIQVQYRVDQVPAGDNQSVLIRQGRDIGEWLIGLRRITAGRGLHNVTHPVRGP